MVWYVYVHARETETWDDWPDDADRQWLGELDPGAQLPPEEPGLGDAPPPPPSIDT